MPKDAYRWMMTAAGAPFARISFDASRPGEGEVTVEIAGCGVCHTDLGYYYDGVRMNHPLPLALGHEISGRVVAAGTGAESWLGKSVIVPAVLPCGECALCQSGRGTICAQQKMPGNDIQGGFASHIVVPGRGLCLVDEDRLGAENLSLADIAVVADAVTTPYHAVRRSDIAPGAFAVVIGVGGVGGYAVQIARAYGATVVAIDVDPEKLAAVAAYGAAATFDARAMDARALKGAVQDFAKQKGISRAGWFIFECSGTAAGQLTAYGLLTHGATLSVVGFTMDKIEIRLSNLMAFDARAIGNWGCPPELYPAALDLVLDGKVKIKPFVEQHPLAAVNEVIAAAHRHELKRRAILVPTAAEAR